MSYNDKYWEKQYNVDMERFIELNICGFNPTGVSTEILSHCLAISAHYFSIIKERWLYSRKNLRGTLENSEKRESLAQRIFPYLQYSFVHIPTAIRIKCI